MNNRKASSKAYTERRLHGGVYIITNIQNGRYLLGHAAELASVSNRFQFAVATGACFEYRLRTDWEAMGANVFRFAILDEIEQQPTQSLAAFLDDLAALEQLLRADLDPAKAY